MDTCARRSAFALTEMPSIIVVLLLLLTLLIVLGGETRRQARLGEDLAKFRQIGAWTGAYGADNSDQFWSLSWRKGQSLSQYPDLNNAPTDPEAAANQAVDILRRVAGREDIQPMLSGWFPYQVFSHLVLADFFGAALPNLTFVSAADEHRMRWSRDPAGFDQGLYLPSPSGSPPGSNQGKRWPYGGSFLLAPAFYDQSPVVANRVSQGGVQNHIVTPSAAALSPGLQPDAAFPAHKVFLHDAYGRHTGARVAYCVLSQARLPILFVDGAASMRAAADSNPGWIPLSPTSSTSTSFHHDPDVWEPPTLNGFTTEPVNGGRFRWTRGTVNKQGVAGRDFGAPETCSGQPGCP